MLKSMNKFYNDPTNIIDFTVSIETEDKITLGTGIIINSQYVLTCNHVVHNEYANNYTFYIRFNLENIRIAVEYDLAYANENEDVALLKIKDLTTIPTEISFPK